jgi:hypothetical protein
MGTADHTCNNPEIQGLIPRFVVDMFDNLNNPLNKDDETSYKIKVSFLEIYGEDVFDLLNASARQTDINARASLPVREDENGRVFVQGQLDVAVKNPASALEVLAMGSQNRVTASTAMNAGSSRSHAVFTIILEQSVKSASGNGDDFHCMTSKLTFVDLAGSERIKRTGAEGQRMKEGIQINSGLFNLGQVINSLADDQKLKSGVKSFVPYRNSKLTHLLKDALGGNSQTLFLACVSPADSNDSESYSTLNVSLCLLPLVNFNLIACFSVCATSSKHSQQTHSQYGQDAIGNQKTTHRHESVDDEGSPFAIWVCKTLGTVSAHLSITHQRRSSSYLRVVVCSGGSRVGHDLGRGLPATPGRTGFYQFRECRYH